MFFSSDPCSRAFFSKCCWWHIFVVVLLAFALLDILVFIILVVYLNNLKVDILKFLFYLSSYFRFRYVNVDSLEHFVSRSRFSEDEGCIFFYTVIPKVIILNNHHCHLTMKRTSEYGITNPSGSLCSPMNLPARVQGTRTQCSLPLRSPPRCPRHCPDRSCRRAPLKTQAQHSCYYILNL